jgi:serine/threonine protein kinase
MPYDVSIDVFALGCLIVELYLGIEIFPGNDIIDQLNKVFAFIGTPTDDTWPEGVQVIN